MISIHFKLLIYNIEFCLLLLFSNKKLFFIKASMIYDAFMFIFFLFIHLYG